MSIATELQNYNDGLISAYNAVSSKGGTIPANKNLDNLPTAINSISGGGGGGGDMTDPKVVYKNTRPSDWLVMPEIGTNDDNVGYFLLQVSSDYTSDMTINMNQGGSIGATSFSFEFGTTDASGNFTANPTYTQTFTTASGKVTVPIEAFGNTTTEGQKQLMMKFSRASGTNNITKFPSTTATNFNKHVREFRGKFTGLSTMPSWFGWGGTANWAETNLTYFGLIGGNALTTFSNFFANCVSLVAVTDLDTSHCTNFSYMFNGCTSLKAIPNITTSSGTNFSYMFQSCTTLTRIPAINTSAGTKFNYMFYDCKCLAKAPSLSTGLGTNFASMFAGCASITVADFSNYNFSSATSTGLNSFFLTAFGQVTITFADTFGASGITNTGKIIEPLQSSTYNPVHIKITKSDGVLQIAVNATTLFSTNSNTFVYVPDDLLTSYQADAKWNTLGTRLKAMSDYPYTS